MKRNRGFTLLEALVVLVILAVLASVAIPSMVGVVRSNRITTATNELNASFAYARSEAMRLNSSLIANPSVDVALCASNDDGTACGEDWTNGWLVVQRNAGLVTEVLRFVQAPARVEILSTAGMAPEYAFDHRGRVSGITDSGVIVQPAGLTIQPVEGECAAGQELVSNISLTPVGQFRSTRAQCT